MAIPWLSAGASEHSFALGLEHVYGGGGIEWVVVELTVIVCGGACVCVCAPVIQAFCPSNTDSLLKNGEAPNGIEKDGWRFS